MVGTQAPRSGGRKWWQWGKAHAVVATAVAVALVVPTSGAMSASADDLVFALIEVAKTATPAAPDALIPGEQVTFDIEVSCSSTQTDCISMKVTDALPPPLTLVSVSSSPVVPGYTVVTTGNSFVATFNKPLAEGGIGLPAGELVKIQVVAAVPANVDASYNGATVTNTAFVTVDNPESNVQDSADVLLSVPLDLKSTISKSVTPATVVGTPNTVVNFDLTATNTSNTGVDTLVVEDPAGAPSTSPTLSTFSRSPG